MVKTGRPNSRNNPKTVSLKLESEAWDLFQDLAQSMGLTRSQLVEKIATHQIPLSQDSGEMMDFLGKSSDS
ncbi:MAG: ribbon-helix-helix domain-containing protein [Nostoc desertorum CM1-VF14]|nr:ribbon-helix-helix domain-containing protein [Nostoc desertorum CM1-VF14]